MASRKHSRTPDDGDDSAFRVNGKRVKLDRLFGGLNLREEPGDHHNHHSSTGHQPYVIPDVAFEVPEPAFAAVPSDFNAFLAHKIRSHYTEVFVSKLAVIPWYDFRLLVVYRFQRWVVRMFGRFAARYNASHGARIPVVRSYDKVMRLASQNHLDRRQLFDIVLHENRRELVRLHAKHARQEAVDTEAAFKDVSYGYWDNLKGFDDDRDDDMDWSADSAPEGSMESNYGSYYYDYNQTTMD